MGEILVYLLLLLSTLALVFGLASLREKSPAASKIVGLLTEAHPKQKRSYFEIRIRPISKNLAARFPTLRRQITPADIEQKLAYAGEPLELDVQQFYGLQLTACCAFALVGFALGAYWAGPVGLILGTLILGAVGIYYPITWLNGKVKERQHDITIAVPDSLDLLSTSMEAGLGFDQALEHLTSRLSGALADEYKRFIRELQLGIPREECYRRLIARNSSEDLRTVVGALLQAHMLGTPLGETLQNQAEGMRVRRIQLAKEAGAQASPKISLVTTVLIAPSVMCLFLAIVTLKLVDNLAPMLAEFFGK